MQVFLKIWDPTKFQIPFVLHLILRFITLHKDYSKVYINLHCFRMPLIPQSCTMPSNIRDVISQVRNFEEKLDSGLKTDSSRIIWWSLLIRITITEIWGGHRVRGWIRYIVFCYPIEVKSLLIFLGQSPLQVAAAFGGREVSHHFTNIINQVDKSGRW